MRSASIPPRFPATYNTLVGANFAGQLSIAAGGTYSWCRASSFASASACADGSTPETGQIEIESRGFALGGASGTYGVYHFLLASALFAVDNRGLSLRALSQTRAPLSGTFAETLVTASTSNHIAKVTLMPNEITIVGVPNLSGRYRLSSSNLGAFSFASKFCRNGTCSGMFNNILGIVYIAQVGNGIFIRH